MNTYMNSSVSCSLEIEICDPCGQTANFVPTGRAFAASKIVGPGLPRLVSSHASGDRECQGRTGPRVESGIDGIVRRLNTWA